MKTITMIMRDERGTVSIEERFSEDTSWCAIAHTFYKFLRAQDYTLPPEKVGADVEAYVLDAPDDGLVKW